MQFGLHQRHVIDHRGDWTTLDVGDHIDIPGVSFSGSPQTLVVATSPGCPACRQSIGFFKQLEEFARSAEVPLDFLQEEPSDGTVELVPAGARNVKVIHIKPSMAGIRAIPTFAVVDRNGVVKAARIGAVTSGAERATVEQLMARFSEVALPLRSITQNELDSLRLASRSLQVVDVRERGQRPDVAPLSGALPIPASELPLRTRFELDQQQPIVIDCRPIGSVLCQWIMVDLRQKGFTGISGLSYVAKAEPRSPFHRLAISFRQLRGEVR